MWRKLRKKVVSLALSQRGNVQIGSILMLGIAMVFIAVGFVIFPVVMEGTDSVLDWTSSSANYTDADFTGLTETTEVVPLIVLIGFISAGVITGFFGIKNLITGV